MYVDVRREIISALESLGVCRSRPDFTHTCEFEDDRLSRLTGPESTPSFRGIMSMTPEEIEQRAVFCAAIPRDLTDGWGVFGHEPGFVICRGLRYRGVRSLNDELWLAGQTTCRVSGYRLPYLQHFDHFPRNKISFLLASDHHGACDVHARLYQLFGSPPCASS